MANEGTQSNTLNSHLIEVLQADELNLQANIKLFRNHGVLDQYERMFLLYDELLDAVQQDHRQNNRNPLFKTTTAGGDSPDHNFVLKCLMFLSARQQLVFAAGHLLRTHVSEISCHVRRAIEAAGIAYLSMSDPDLGEIYVNADRKEFSKRTAEDDILPESNALTNVLREAMGVVNELTHSNFMSFVQRIKFDYTSNGEEWSYKFDLFYHEVNNPRNDHNLRTALWMLRVGERLARLFGITFELPGESGWFQHLDDFKNRLDLLYEELESIVLPEES